MSLDHKKVKEIAYLARLNIEDTDIEQATAELNNILSLMDKLGEIDTGDSEPMAHPLNCLLYTSPSPRDRQKSRMPSSA